MTAKNSAANSTTTTKTTTTAAAVASQPAPYIPSGNPIQMKLQQPPPQQYDPVALQRAAMSGIIPPQLMNQPPPPLPFVQAAAAAATALKTTVQHSSLPLPPHQYGGTPANLIQQKSHNVRIPERLATPVYQISSSTGSVMGHNGVHGNVDKKMQVLYFQQPQQQQPPPQLQHPLQQQQLQPVQQQQQQQQLKSLHVQNQSVGVRIQARANPYGVSSVGVSDKFTQNRVKNNQAGEQKQQEATRLAKMSSTK